MMRWTLLLTALLTALALYACTGGDAKGPDVDLDKIEVVYVDREEQARLDALAAENFDYGAELASFIDDYPDLDDWRPSGAVAIHDQAWMESSASSEVENADELASYGIEAYYRRSFTHPDRVGQTLELEMIRMQTLLGAFGFYATHRDPAFELESKGLGNQGYVDRNRLTMWHSRWIVRATHHGSTEESDTVPMLKDLGSTLSARFKEVQRPILPRHLRAFPGTDVLPNTQAYALGSFLGIDFLPRAVTADFARPEGIITGFFMDFDSNNEAATTFDRLVEHFRAEDALVDEYLGMGTESIRAEVPGHGRAVFILQREYIGGYMGFEGELLPTDLLASYVQSVDSLFPDDSMLRAPRESDDATDSESEGGAFESLFGGGGGSEGSGE